MNKKITNVKSYLKTMGYLGLQPSVMAYDKQKHCLLAVFLTIVTFFPTLDKTGNNTISFFVSFAIVSLISWAIEFFQKWFTKDRHFDNFDAIYMQITNIIVVILYIIIY